MAKNGRNFTRITDQIAVSAATSTGHAYLPWHDCFSKRPELRGCVGQVEINLKTKPEVVFLGQELAIFLLIKPENKGKELSINAKYLSDLDPSTDEFLAKIREEVSTQQPLAPV